MASRPTGSLVRAVELLAAGAWQQAHEIVQRETSALAAWLHGIVHTLEGDLDNARYWYRKADRAFPSPDAVQEEIAAARRMVQGETRPGTDTPSRPGLAAN
ncbi:MAG: hypothetical protein ACE5NA_11260 [Nitrospiraceae bacterium]